MGAGSKEESAERRISIDGVKPTSRSLTFDNRPTRKMSLKPIGQLGLGIDKVCAAGLDYQLMRQHVRW